MMKGFGSVLVEHFSGVITYDGVGKAVSLIKGTSFFPTAAGGPGSFPVGTFETRCEFQYQVFADMTYLEVGNCVGRLPAGGGVLPNETVQVMGVRARGHIGVNREVLLGSVEPSVQHIVLSGGYEADRICDSSEVAVMRPAAQPQ